MKVLVVAGLALLVSGSAAAQDAPADGPDPNERICQVEKVTGSRARRNRICMTRAEWDQLRRDTKHDIDDLQRNSGAVPRQQSGAGATAGSG